MSRNYREELARTGVVNLGQALRGEELDDFRRLYDADRGGYGYFWRDYGYHQQANYDALVTTPEFDRLIRHGRILPVVEELMGGPVCFGEVGLRYMAPYAGPLHRSWHRDRPHWMEHPLRMDYVQLMVYLTDVDEGTHCISFSPESVADEILEEKESQLARGGVLDLHGPAGTCALFNVAVLHTATTRPTVSERKTVQIYYGHRNRPPLSNDSGIPATLWRDGEDEETRAFYGVLNERTRLYAAAFGGEGRAVTPG